MFEEILSPKFKTALGPELLWAYDYSSSSAIEYLSQAYFRKAVSAQDSGGDSDTWISKLRELAISDKGKGDGETVYEIQDASLYLGHFLRRYAGADESVWKPCFRKSLLEGIDLLHDEDRKEHVEGYLRFVSVLLPAGDRKKALEVLAVLLKPLEQASASFPDKEVLEALQSLNFHTNTFG